MPRSSGWAPSHGARTACGCSLRRRMSGDALAHGSFPERACIAQLVLGARHAHDAHGTRCSSLGSALTVVLLWLSSINLLVYAKLKSYNSSHATTCGFKRLILAKVLALERGPSLWKKEGSRRILVIGGLIFTTKVNSRNSTKDSTGQRPILFLIWGCG